MTHPVKKLWLDLTPKEKHRFYQLSGISVGVMRKYTRPMPEDRIRPSIATQQKITETLNKIRPGCVTYDDVVNYCNEPPKKAA